MLDILRHISLLALAAWMALASGGMSFFDHVCQCNGQEHFSLTSHHACPHHTTSDADGSDHHSCCTGPDQGASTCPAGQGDGCCNTRQVIFLKTSDYTAPAGPSVQLQASELPAQPAPQAASGPLVVYSTNRVLPPPDIFQRKHYLLRSGAYHSALSCS